MKLVVFNLRALEGMMNDMLLAHTKEEDEVMRAIFKAKYDTYKLIIDSEPSSIVPHLAAAFTAGRYSEGGFDEDFHKFRGGLFYELSNNETVPNETNII